MTVLGTLRAPFHALACGECAERLHVPRPTAYRPKIAYQHEGGPLVPGPSIRLDVGRLVWRRTGPGRYSLEAFASASCPSCLRPQELSSLVSSCRGVAVSGLSCPVHNVDMAVDRIDVTLGEATDGVAKVEIRADAVCGMCAVPRTILRDARLEGSSLGEDTVTRFSFDAETVALSSMVPDVVLLAETEALLDAIGGPGRIGGASVVAVGSGYPAHRLHPSAVIALAVNPLEGEVIVADSVTIGIHGRPVRVPIPRELVTRLKAGPVRVRVDAVDSEFARAAIRLPVPTAVVIGRSAEIAARFITNALARGGWDSRIPETTADGRILLAAEGRDLGSGFGLSERLVLTAAHVVQGHQASRLSFVTAAGIRVPVERIDSDTGSDVAILRVAESISAGPRLVQAEPDMRWRVMARPRGNDPQLTGIVTAVDHPIRNAGGTELRVLQLQVTEAMADFGGYSGSAVMSDGAVLGMLVEQVHERHRDGARTRRAANVLYAVPISLVVQQFELPLLVTHLD